MLDPGVVGVADGWHSVAPALVVPQQFAGPVGDVERRIGEDVVGFEVWVKIAEEVSAGCVPRLASMPRMARFMWASRQVVGLDSCP